MTSTVINAIAKSGMVEREIIDQKGNPLSFLSYFTDVSLGRELLVDSKAKETRYIVINI